MRSQESLRRLAELQEYVAEGSAARLVQFFKSQATAHAGTAPAKIKSQVIRLIQQQYGQGSPELYTLAFELCADTDPTAQEVGAMLLPDCYPSDGREDVQAAIHDTLQRLADSTNWEVREWVASACGQVLARHYEGWFPKLVVWSQHPAENIRRATVLALMYSAAWDKPQRAQSILDVYETLLPDRSKYIRDNLGPFAIGSYLMKAYPEQVLARMPTWMKSEDEQVRWNIAMVFSAAPAAQYARKAMPILEALALDTRPYIRRALAKALQQIVKRDPEFHIERT